MDLVKKRAAVVGLGRSGAAAATLLAKKGAVVVANDAAPRGKLSKEALALEALGVTIEAGAHPSKIFEICDLVVVSPGVPSFAALDAFEARGGEVIGELELASRFITSPIALVGGTNGKSTTTALVHEMMKWSKKKSFIGGNFGEPPAEALARGEDYDVWVLEISSFQAERVPSLHAKAHALLNVTDDHLDRYPSFDAYADAKGNPFVNMNASDVAVIPLGDAICEKQARRGAARIVTFSATDPRADVSRSGDRIVDRTNGNSYPIELLRIDGEHNVANACAAIAVATAMGAPPQAIAGALGTFEGLGHRLALVAEIDGVFYYDDSKGTNVGASTTALLGLRQQKAVLIAGGRDKLGSYQPLVDALRAKGRALVLIGEAADRIEEAAKGTLPIRRAGSMDEAVAIAKKLAQRGDAVLLSPACSSFDMFRDYKDRGDAFVRAVRALREAP